MEPFAQIIGQKPAIALLQSALSQDRIAPAYLFTGIDGIGRQLTALAFAAALIEHGKSRRVNTKNHPDLLWVEPTYVEKGKLLSAAEAIGLKKRAAPQIRLEQIRQISEFLSQPPLVSGRSLVVIEAAHTMPEASANALLKTLEEPGQATIILIAPQVSSLLPTLVSRCQRIPFYPLSLLEVKQVLADQPLPPEILNLAQGSPGAAIANFRQFQAVAPEILAAIQKPPTTAIQALTLAKTITKELELESQIWLLDYWQNYLWQPSKAAITTMASLETAKQQLMGYIQPRLVWEVLLLELIASQENTKLKY